MKYMLEFSDSETAKQAKKLVKDEMKYINVSQSKNMLHFKSLVSKKNAKRILKRLGMRGLDYQ